jgi:integrase
MLVLWRRHESDCPHADEGRDYKKCRCSIWMDWRVNGRRLRRPMLTRDWQSAQMQARKIEADGLDAKTAVTTIDAAIKEFETYQAKQRNIKEPTQRKYKYFFKKVREFSQARGLVFLSQFDVGEANAFRNTWKLGPLSHVKQLERMKAFFRFCLDMEWIKSSPTKSFKPPKVEDAEVVPFTEDEINKITKALEEFEHVNRARLDALANLMLSSGLRISDACVISRKAITKDSKGYSLTLRTEKTGARVTCPLPNAVAKKVLDADVAEHPFWTTHSNSEDCASYWRKLFGQVFKKAGVEGTPHQLRHTFAKRLLIAGAPVGTVAVLLGHRKVAITERHYSRWIVERQAVLDIAVRNTWK